VVIPKIIFDPSTKPIKSAQIKSKIFQPYDATGKAKEFAFDSYPDLKLLWVMKHVSGTNGSVEIPHDSRLGLSRELLTPPPFSNLSMGIQSSLRFAMLASSTLMSFAIFAIVGEKSNKLLIVKVLMRAIAAPDPIYSGRNILWSSERELKNSLRDGFDYINIQEALTSKEDKRKDQNMIKLSKGFNWGSGAVSCAYWRDHHLRNVLLARSKVLGQFRRGRRTQRGHFRSCIHFQYAMNPENDVILAQFVNAEPRPPDHGQ